mgnify:CR=1 FL=1|jgi:hypothetical protein
MKVYRRIDGELVPVLGNRRDPNRNYRQTINATSGESCLVEFTDEEEAELITRKAKWAADAPQREAQKIEDERKQQEFRNSIKYEPRLVAYLDILGWSKAIENSVKDEEFLKDLGVSLQIFDAHRSQADWMRENAGEKGWPGDPRVTQFSDCIVLSTSPDHYGADSLISSIYSICFNFLQKGLLIRGGIVLGSMYHRDNSLFGPALNDAYRMESTKADFPRIILQKELADAWGRGNKFLNKDGSLLGNAKTWRNFEDGWSYFDYLQPLLANTFESPPTAHLEIILNNAHNVAIRGLEEFSGDKKIRPKYEWFADYVNEVLDEYPQVKLPKIEI